MTETQTRLDGRRFVLLMYGVIIGIAGVLGVVLGAFITMGSAPRLFFLIPLPPTALGFAAYGMVTVAVGLGIPLLLVIYLSERLDTETARGKDT
ncbi:cox cluster protein [Haloplanus litoreus]|uniref:Cox cluster protein n=1 Tax=Haloplanus litoreus TaxID=767515 RepID=A0ABD6A1D0_9EURY